VASLTFFADVTAVENYLCAAQIFAAETRQAAGVLEERFGIESWGADKSARYLCGAEASQSRSGSHIVGSADATSITRRDTYSAVRHSFARA
jgi:hypothetical protein